MASFPETYSSACSIFIHCRQNVFISQSVNPVSFRKYILFNAEKQVHSAYGSSANIRYKQVLYIF